MNNTSAAPEVPWYGYYVNSKYEDRSKGVNPRYGKDSPLGSRGHNINEAAFKYLKVGDVVSLYWVKNYGHGATMVITKLNRKTVNAVEIKNSYGAGTAWRLGPMPEGQLYFAMHFMPEERLHELAAKFTKAFGPEFVAHREVT